MRISRRAPCARTLVCVVNRHGKSRNWEPQHAHQTVRGVLLAQLMYRLEAATSRLEDIAVAQTGAHGSVADLNAPVAGAAAGAPSTRDAGGAQPASAALADAPSDAPAVQAWDAGVGPALAAYEQQSQSLGGAVAEQVRCVACGPLTRRRSMFSWCLCICARLYS